MILDQYLRKIGEAKRTSITKVSRSTKIKRATSSMATSMARKKNDPLYKNMIKYRDLYHRYRTRLYKKYSSKTRSKARR